MDLQSHLATRLQYQHKSLVDMIDGLSIEMIRKEVFANQWSIYQNMVHLQTYQHVFLNRVKEITEKENPVFEKYTAEEDPLFIENCGKTSKEIMHDIITVRKKIALLVLAFPESVLKRKATHNYYGTMTLVQWINFFLLHEGHHLFKIFKLRKELQKMQIQSS